MNVTVKHATQNLISQGSATTDEDKAVKKNSYAKFVLAALILLVIGLSYFFLSKQSLRLDESQSLWQSSRTPSGILYVISQDVHVPLYPLLIHYWMLFFGNQVPTARILSLAFFILCIPLAYNLGKMAYNQATGLFTASLVAISPFLNWYGNEIRMYSLLTLLTLINQYFFLKLFLPGSRQLSRKSLNKIWWGFGISAFFGVYTHYFFWLLLLVDGLFYLFYYKNFPAKSLRNLSIIALALGAAIAPWLWYVHYVNQLSNAQPILTKPSSVDFFNVFSQFIFGFQTDHINTLIVSLWPLSVVFAFLSLKKNVKIPPQTVYFFIATILPVILAFGISVVYRPLFLTRYLIFTIPSLYLFFSWFFSIYPKRLGTAFKAALVVIMLLTLFDQASGTSTPAKENYQEVAQYLSQKTTAEDVIAISAPFTIYPIEYYYNGPAGMVTLPIWDRFKSGAIPVFSQANLPSDVAQVKGSHRLAYLVLSYNQGYETNIKTYFDTHYERVDQKNFSNGLNVYVYKLRYDNTNTNTLIKSVNP